MNALQHHKDKSSKGKQLLNSTTGLPHEMQEIFNMLRKYAFEYLFHHKPFSEEEISYELFNSSDIPWDFDGLGLFKIYHTEKLTGESKGYLFLHKPIQELLAVLYLITLQPQEQLVELKEIFGNKAYEMVWVFYAGMTSLRNIDEILKQYLPQKYSQPITQVPVKTLRDLVEAWKHCHSHFMPMTTSNRFSAEFLLTLMLCCYEARNEKACKTIAAYVYPDLVCRIEIPPNCVTPYLLLAVSYFISHSGKMWSLRCDASIQSGVELLCKYIVDSKSANGQSSNNHGGLWVWCFVVKFSQIDAYCRAIKSQQSLQWIHLLNGSVLGDEGTAKLCECLTPDCAVIKVELENCKIGSKGLKSIGRMLKINGKILHIDLRKNFFSLDDVMQFLHDIENQMCLEYLLLDKKFIENPKVSSVLEKIKSIREMKNAKDLTINYR